MTVKTYSAVASPLSVDHFPATARDSGERPSCDARAYVGARRDKDPLYRPCRARQREAGSRRGQVMGRAAGAPEGRKMRCPVSTPTRASRASLRPPQRHGSPCGPDATWPTLIPGSSTRTGSCGGPCRLPHTYRQGGRALAVVDGTRTNPVRSSGPPGRALDDAGRNDARGSGATVFGERGDAGTNAVQHGVSSPLGTGEPAFRAPRDPFGADDPLMYVPPTYRTITDRASASRGHSSRTGRLCGAAPVRAWRCPVIRPACCGNAGGKRRARPLRAGRFGRGRAARVVT